MTATPERSLERIANEMARITRVLEALNQNFVTWATKKPGSTDKINYVPVEGYAGGGVPEFKKDGE